MGEQRKDALRVTFDRKVKLEFHGTKVTSNAGLLAYRELDEALGLTTMVDAYFVIPVRARILGMALPLCSGNRSVVAWAGMKIPMMPTVWRWIRRCGR